ILLHSRKPFRTRNKRMSTAGTTASNGQPKHRREQTICEFWPSVSENNAPNYLAGRMPLGLVILVYFPAYVAKVLNVFTAVRYTLTNQRLRVERGMRKAVVQSIPLEEIADVRLANEVPFTRTGDLEIVCKGQVALRMVGLQDPRPTRQTILDA